MRKGIKLVFLTLNLIINGGKSIIVHMNYHIFLIYYSVCGHLNWFHNLAIVDSSGLFLYYESLVYIT